MKLDEYEAIRGAFAAMPCNVYPDMDATLRAHPGTTLDTLVSIYSQECSRRIRASHGRHARAIETHAKKYLAGEDVLSLADAADFPPCQLMRLLLEHLLCLGHKTVGQCMRDPWDKIPSSPPAGSPAALALTATAAFPMGASHSGNDDGDIGASFCRRLCVDVERCAAWDHIASPGEHTISLNSRCFTK